MRLDGFERLSVIGKGSFGKVLLVRKADTGGLFAMKILNKTQTVKRKQVRVRVRISVRARARVRIRVRFSKGWLG